MGFASPARHQTIGCIERASQTLWHKIKKMTNFGKLCWKITVTSATNAVDMSFSRAIKTSHFILKNGYLPDALKSDINSPEGVGVNERSLKKLVKLFKSKYTSLVEAGMFRRQMIIILVIRC